MKDCQLCSYRDCTDCSVSDLRYSFTQARASLGVPEGDAGDQVDGHQVLGLIDLSLGGRPAQDGLDLPDPIRGSAGGFGDVRLLGQVLAEQRVRWARF